MRKEDRPSVFAAVGAIAAAIGAGAAAAAIIFQICNFNSDRAQRISGEKALLRGLMDRVDRDLSTRVGKDLLSKSKSKSDLPWTSAEQRLYETLIAVILQNDLVENNSLMNDLLKALEGESSGTPMSASDVVKIRNAIKQNEDALQR